MPGTKGEPGTDGLAGVDGIPGLKGDAGLAGPQGQEVRCQRGQCDLISMFRENRARRERGGARVTREPLAHQA